MPRLREKDYVTFNDGVLDVCGVSKGSLITTKIKRIRFGNRTVGVTRFWQAKISSNEIERMVAILEAGEVTTKDVCVIGERQYKVLQVEHKYDEYPPCMFLSLASIQTPYKDERDG